MIGSGGFLDQGLKNHHFCGVENPANQEYLMEWKQSWVLGKLKACSFLATCLCIYEYITYMFKGKNSSEKNHQRGGCLSSHLMLKSRKPYTFEDSWLWVPRKMLMRSSLNYLSGPLQSPPGMSFKPLQVRHQPMGRSQWQQQWQQGTT